jgi:predicted Zn-dependent protease
MAFAYRTGYTPKGLVNVLRMLKQKEQTATQRGSWFSTHPPLSDRIEKCSHRMGRYPDSSSLATVQGRFNTYRRFF